VWADERARELLAAAAARGDPGRGAPVLCLLRRRGVLAYFCFWLPGLILNLYFLDAAKRTKRETGREPAGLGALRDC